MKQSSSNYTSPQTQNEILKVMAAEFLQEVCISMQYSTFMTFIMDETAEVFSHEQVIFVLCHEEFISCIRFQLLTV